MCLSGTNVKTVYIRISDGNNYMKKKTDEERWLLFVINKMNKKKKTNEYLEPGTQRR